MLYVQKVLGSDPSISSTIQSRQYWAIATCVLMQYKAHSPCAHRCVQFYTDLHSLYGTPREAEVQYCTL